MKIVNADSITLNKLDCCIDKARVISYREVKNEVKIRIKRNISIYELFFGDMNSFENLTYKKLVRIDNLLKRNILTITKKEYGYDISIRYNVSKIILYKEGDNLDMYKPLTITKVSEDRIFEKELSENINKFIHLFHNLTDYISEKIDFKSNLIVHQFKEYTGKMEKYNYTNGNQLFLFNNEKEYYNAKLFYKENSSNLRELFTFSLGKNFKVSEKTNLRIFEYFILMYPDITIEECISKTLCILKVSNLRKDPKPRMLPDPNKDLSYHTKRRVHGYRS